MAKKMTDGEMMFQALKCFVAYVEAPPERQREFHAIIAEGIKDAMDDIAAGVAKRAKLKELVKSEASEQVIMEVATPCD